MLAPQDGRAGQRPGRRVLAQLLVEQLRPEQLPLDVLDQRDPAERGERLPRPAAQSLVRQHECCLAGGGDGARQLLVCPRQRDSGRLPHEQRDSPDRRGSDAAALIPLVFLLIMTSWALVVNLRNFVREEQWVLAPLDAVIFVLAMWLIVEAALALRQAFRDRPAPGSMPREAADAPASVVARANPSNPADERRTGETSGGDVRDDPR